MKNKSTAFLVQAAAIAAVYVVLTILFAPISYGEVQVRVSEALTVLPFFTPAAVPGLAVGCLIANILGGGPLILSEEKPLAGSCSSHHCQCTDHPLCPALWLWCFSPHLDDDADGRAGRSDLLRSTWNAAAVCA